MSGQSHASVGLVGNQTRLSRLSIGRQSFQSSRLTGMGVASEKTEFLTGGGLMGALMRDHSWSTSPLGNPEHWTPSVKTAVGLLLPAGGQIGPVLGPRVAALL